VVTLCQTPGGLGGRYSKAGNIIASLRLTAGRVADASSRVSDETNGHGRQWCEHARHGTNSNS
jgi:hypothetical protein